jgi:hypothetical protein
MTVLFAFYRVTRSLTAGAGYPAICGTGTSHDPHCTNVDDASPTYGKRVVIGDIGSPLPVEFAGLIGQTRVSRTATVRSHQTSGEMAARRRCFMFRLFHFPSRHRARDPPADG